MGKPTGIKPSPATIVSRLHRSANMQAIFNLNFSDSSTQAPLAQEPLGLIEPKAANKTEAVSMLTKLTTSYINHHEQLTALSNSWKHGATTKTQSSTTWVWTAALPKLQLQNSLEMHLWFE